MATYSVQLDTSQMEKAVKSCTVSVENYLRVRLNRILNRLANDVAKPIAQQAFGFDGEVTVMTRKIPRGYAIMALGESVCFLEFGAGVDTDTHHPFTGNVPFMVYPGSWSKEHSQHFSKNGYWYYGGKRYEGIQARRGMYEAYKAILQNIDWIVEEELSR